jgi:hypothetical protein
MLCQTTQLFNKDKELLSQNGCGLHLASRKCRCLRVFLYAYANLLMRCNLIAGFFRLVISHFIREARA